MVDWWIQLNLRIINIFNSVLFDNQHIMYTSNNRCSYQLCGKPDMWSYNLLNGNQNLLASSFYRYKLVLNSKSEVKTIQYNALSLISREEPPSHQNSHVDSSRIPFNFPLQPTEKTKFQFLSYLTVYVKLVKNTWHHKEASRI